MILLTEIPEDDLAFIEAKTSLVICGVCSDGIYGVMDFMYTYALVNGVQTNIQGMAYMDRYCYSKKTFNRDAMKDICESWGGSGEPTAGWVKYKGIHGEVPPGVSLPSGKFPWEAQ